MRARHSTLLLRLMGAGRTLQRAIAELKALPREAPDEDRFGALQEDLAAIVRATHDTAILRDWLKLTGTGTADEIMARLRGHRAS